jgi:Sec-independent protein translocase protein TatA
MGFGHIGEIIGLLLLALIIFGPKRFIEMGSQLGKSLRETRDALKEMNWSLTGDEQETPGSPAGGQRDRIHIVESAPTSSAPPSDES